MAAIYVISCMIVFLLLMYHVGRRWGVQLYEDYFTWILCVGTSTSIVTGAMSLLSFITGHLSGRL